jgi:hypothetical protein
MFETSPRAPHIGLTTMPKTVRLTYLVAGGLAALTGRISAAEPVDFNSKIKPLLEANCVSCHGAEKPKGKFRVLTLADVLKGGEDGTALVPGDPDKSLLYTSTILPADHDDLMPPSNKGGPLPKESTDLIKQWIVEGAKWPEGVVLVAAKKAEEAPKGDELATAKGIHETIVKSTKETSAADMKPYKETISGTGVTFEMVPIPAGEFTMGSPESEEGRKPDEGPPVKVKLSPFWMGKLEVTWSEYELFMRPEIELDLRKKHPSEETIRTSCRTR